MEGIPMELAGEITRRLEIPTIGIGAGVHCDGQVLVCYDLLGLNREFAPKFVKKYADGAGLVDTAARAFIDEVRGAAFPADEHSFHSKNLRLYPTAVPDGEAEGPAPEAELPRLYAKP
jgi:3-methyl-2-oxobutanoate hydroxymethyltransferase